MSISLALNQHCQQQEIFIMVSGVNFANQVCQEFDDLSSQEQGLHRLGVIFKGWISSREIQQCYLEEHDIKAIEAISHLDGQIEKLKMKAFKQLNQLGNAPLHWDKDCVDKIINNMMQDYWDQWKKQRNDRCVFIELASITEDSPKLIAEWLQEGSNLQCYEIYRALFTNQNEHTASVVKALLKIGFVPDNENINSLFVKESPHTVEILEALTPTQCFSPSCFTFAFRYCQDYLKQIVDFLLQNEVHPEEYHRSFTSRHLPSFCKEQFVCGKRSSADEYFFLKSQSCDRSLKRFDEIINCPDKDSLGDLVAHIYNGNSLNKRGFNKLISQVITGKECGDYSVELLHVYFIFGFQLSPLQLKNLLKSDSERSLLVIKLARMYGLEITNDLAANQLGNQKNIDALFVATDRYQKMSKPELKELIKTYVQNSPGLFELLIQSRVRPSFQLEMMFHEVPKRKFFKHLLDEESLFEANARNNHLLENAIQTSNKVIIFHLIEKGFQLTINNVIQSILHQPRIVTYELIKKLKDLNQSPINAPKPPLTKEIIDDPIALVLRNQNKDTCKRVKKLIDTGEKPCSHHLTMIMNHLSIFSPELICLLEENGVSIESI